ncbi:hypothetical protein [Actinoallomurus spadix]|uniref:DUF5753 domain-containing protein n=1 Tax=Actinoallomurus spadix TaxID=79912 RepID=A0ABN0VUV9_9ACTN|nr:hypothetical protein [Actinoallomurus spadix]
MEGPAGALYVESVEAERIAGMYDRLEKAALTESESVGFVAALAEEFE